MFVDIITDRHPGLGGTRDDCSSDLEVNLETSVYIPRQLDMYSVDQLILVYW